MIDEENVLKYNSFIQPQTINTAISYSCAALMCLYMLELWENVLLQ